MSELSEKQLQDLVRERGKIFSPDWFADLSAARLGFGDTFWLGNYGVLLFVVPAMVLLGGVLYAQAPGALVPVLRALIFGLGLWRVVVLQALARQNRRSAWPVVGVLWTATEALGCFGYALWGGA